jgi:hypothetical protein
MQMMTKAKFLIALIIALVVISAPVIYHKLYWAYQQYAVIRIIEKNRFPNSVVIAKEVDINWGMTSNWCWVTAFVTFRSSSSFEEVKAWYERHPEGIKYFEDGRGLDLLSNSQDSSSSPITYRVSYQKWISAFICPETYERR